MKNVLFVTSQTIL